MFIIEDEFHAEWQDGEFATLHDAISELKRRAKIPWDEEPNKAPCTNWRNCGRQYVVIEYDDSVSPWKEQSRIYILDIRAKGVKWLESASIS